MDEDQSMQEDLNAAIALSLEAGSEWRQFAVMDHEEESVSMQLAGSPPIASFMEAASVNIPSNLSPPGSLFSFNLPESAQAPHPTNPVWMMGPVQSPMGMMGLSQLSQSMSGMLGANMNDPRLAQFVGSELMNMMESSPPGGDAGSDSGDGSWYCMQPDGSWQQYESAISNAIDAAFRTATGGSINIQIEGRRFVGSRQFLRQYTDGSPEDGSSMPLPVRRFSQEEAYRRATTALFGQPVGPGWPGAPPPQMALKRGTDSAVGAAAKNCVPKSAEEWRAAVERIASRLGTRPFAGSVMDEVQRSLNLLFEGRKSLKARGPQLRRGDAVVCVGGEDGMQGRRGVIETDLGDGAFMVKWTSGLGSSSEARRMESRFLIRQSPSQSHTVRMLNQYLLQRAIPSKESRVVEELISQGADANSADDGGSPALSLAVSNKCPVAILQALLLAGADTEALAPVGSALQIAVRNQDVDAVECLLEHGADASNIDLSAASGCIEPIAEMIQRHRASALCDEAKTVLEEETHLRILPLIIEATASLSDSHGMQSSTNCLMHLVDKAPSGILRSLFFAGAPDNASPLQSGIPPLNRNMLLLCSVLQHLEDTESLDLMFTALKLIQNMVDKVPEVWPMLVATGIVRWVEQLSSAKRVKQDTQAGLISSRGGRIKDKHVSKLASDLLVKYPPSCSPIMSNLVTELARIAKCLSEGQLNAYPDLASTLERHRCPSLRKGLVRSQHLLTSGLPTALLYALRGGGGQWDGRQHWLALTAALDVDKGRRGGLLQDLVRPLIEHVATQPCWTLNSSGSDDLAELSRSVRVELHQNQPLRASGAFRAGGVRRLPPISLNVEPLCRLRDLEEHIIRTVRPPPEYLEFCFDLVGCTIEERPLRSSVPFRRATIVSFSLQPDMSCAIFPANSTSSPTTPRPLELDSSTLAGCLTISVDTTQVAGSGSVTVTCTKKGSPAGTVQANRAFSPSTDGSLGYFEVTVKKRGPSGAIGVGLARGNYSKTKMPGWEPVSHAWHGDDGCTFNSCGSGTPFSAPWSEGDVIGCGVDFSRRAIFFTRNGLLQGAPFRGVDVSGLIATLGFQTKGETVGVSFAPPFVYDLATHELPQPQSAVHLLRYDDNGSERWLNLAVRDYGIMSSPPSVGAFGDRLRNTMNRVRAHCEPAHAVDAFAALLDFARRCGDDSFENSRVLGGAELERILSREGGSELLDVAGLVGAGNGFVARADLVDQGKLQTLINLLQESVDSRQIADSDSMKVEGSGSGEAKRDQTVMITIPEGFPPELFFEEVEDALRQALSAADPLVAPASGHVGEAYRWPDRGFDHEEAWYEFLMSSLAERQTGAIARGQTRYEAEALCTRLANVVQCEIITDDSEDFTLRAREVKRAPGVAGTNAVLVGDRVQVMETSGGDWVLGTVLDTDQEQRHGVQCDDGLWLTGVAPEMVRSVRAAGNGRGGRGGRMEVHYDMYGDQRFLEQMAAHAMRAGMGLAIGKATPDLKRTFSCFEVGDVNRDGYTAPKRRIDVWDGSMLPPLAAPPLAPSARRPKRLRCSFCIATTPSSEMVKVKNAAQLNEIIQMSAGEKSFGAILFIDAPGRPPSGQSWPRHIHSASTLVKELAQRFSHAIFARALSGSMPELLGRFGLQPGFAPTIILFLGGDIVAVWQQQAKSESMWLPAATPEAATSGSSCHEMGADLSPGRFWRTLHRNEFASVLQPLAHLAPPETPASRRGLAERNGALALPRAGAPAVLPVMTSIHECVLRSAAAATAAASTSTSSSLASSAESGAKGQPLVLEFGVQVLEDSEADRGDDGCDAAAMHHDAPADSLEPAGHPGEAVGLVWADTDGPDERTRNVLELLALLHDRLADAPAPRKPLKGGDEGSQRVQEPSATNEGERDGGASEVSEAAWRSEALTRRLGCQLNDALSVSCGALPRWCHTLPRRCPALFSVDARRRLLALTAFGPSHTVYRLQESKVAAARARNADRMRQHQQRLARAREAQDVEGIARATDEVDEAERRVYSVRIGSIFSDLARVSRGHVLENAARLLAYHGCQRHLLEVQFHGEDGFGTGVTQNFYEAVCAALQRRAANRAAPMWIPDGHADAGLPEAEGAGAYLSNPEGLFPHPLPPGHPSLPTVCDLFLLLGRLFGKACRDRFTVPLPLHPHFFRVLLAPWRPEAARPVELLRTFGRPVDAIAPSDDWTPMDLARALSTVWEEVEEELGRCGGSEAECRAVMQRAGAREFMGEYLNRSFECSLADFLDQSQVVMVDPLTQAPLLGEDGARERLTVERLGEYLTALASAWFDSGIRAQLQAFRQGLGESLPLSTLAVLGAGEWSVMLCGERGIAWDRESLVQHLKLVSNEQGAKYTKESKPFEMLVEELVKMSNQDRARFLDFVTACPRLPPGGLASLSIEIAPGAGPSAFPRSRTCTKLMWLPPYQTQEQLSEKLYAALANSKEGGFHEHNT